MLVLSRRVGQQIRIGESVVVTLLKLERNKARIGVDAPADVPVFRQELLDFDRRRPGAPPAARPGAVPSTFGNGLGPRPPAGRGFSAARTLWDSVKA